MLQSIYNAASSGHLNSPFQAKCDAGLQVNENRVIQAAAVAEGEFLYIVKKGNLCNNCLSSIITSK